MVDMAEQTPIECAPHTPLRGHQPIEVAGSCADDRSVVPSSFWHPSMVTLLLGNDPGNSS